MGGRGGGLEVVVVVEREREVFVVVREGRDKKAAVGEYGMSCCNNL
jgi:hypothetical protein